MKTLKPIFSILLSLIPFCAAVSCRAQAVSDVLENDLLENAVRLSPRALEYVPDGFESSVYVWRDSLAIVLNTADGKECMDILEVFRIQDWSILGTALPYGSGGGEFFYMQSALGGDSLILFDIVKKQFVVLDPDARRKDWLEDIRPTAAVSYVAQAFIGYDDRVLMLNPRYFEDSSGHSNRQPRLAVTDTSWQWTVPETEYFSTNVTQGSLAADAERGRVFFFDGNSSMADLCIVRQILPPAIPVRPPTARRCSPLTVTWTLRTTTMSSVLTGTAIFSGHTGWTAGSGLFPCRRTASPYMSGRMPAGTAQPPVFTAMICYEIFQPEMLCVSRSKSIATLTTGRPQRAKRSGYCFRSICCMAASAPASSFSSTK